MYSQIILTLSFVLAFGSAMAVEILPKRIKKGAMITVVDYEKYAKVYQVIVRAEESIDHLYVTPEDLAEKTDNEALKKVFSTDPTQQFDKDYIVAEDLPLVSPHQALYRFKKFKDRVLAAEKAKAANSKRTLASTSSESSSGN